MDKKLHYTLRDLEAAGPLRGMGVKRMGTCPRCGHDHLSIDTEKRLFHCFYAGCGHSGRIYDERPDIESLAAEAGGAFMSKDSEPWLPLTAKE